MSVSTRKVLTGRSTYPGLAWPQMTASPLIRPTAGKEEAGGETTRPPSRRAAPSGWLTSTFPVAREPYWPTGAPTSVTSRQRADRSQVGEKAGSLDPAFLISSAVPPQGAVHTKPRCPAGHGAGRTGAAWIVSLGWLATGASSDCGVDEPRLVACPVTAAGAV